MPKLRKRAKGRSLSAASRLRLSSFWLFEVNVATIGSSVLFSDQTPDGKPPGVIVFPFYGLYQR
jgi:hypothetical protein